MNIAMVQQRLLGYQCQNVTEQDNALKEIAQEIALMALARAGFFDIAAFQGGTCLRILYGLERFSEDLNFVLIDANEKFAWHKYLSYMLEEFNAYGFSLEITERAKLNQAVKAMFLKADSMGALLLLQDKRTHKPKLQIKLEIDTRPPAGSAYELKYLDFPLPYSIKTQDLASLFASKCHALLCRPYLKGRDWYDFSWYVARQTPINFTLLGHALAQAGPWQGQTILVDKIWFVQAMQEKITHLNCELAKQDVQRFLRPRQLQALEVWSPQFFLACLDKLKSYLI